jgi:hypothetical protein
MEFSQPTSSLGRVFSMKMTMEELGYPHELILSASNRSTSVIKGQYRMRIKLLANLFNFALKKKREDIKIESKEDPELLILASLTSGSFGSLGEKISEYREKLNVLVEDFQTTQSETSYFSFRDFLREGVFLHILCKEIGGSSLFLEEDISRFSKILDHRERDLEAIFSAIQIWGTRKADSVPDSVVSQFSSFEDGALKDSVIFLSYALAVDYPKSKHELLVVHYRLVKSVMDEFKEVVSQENLADQVLENLFKTAIILFLCGYLKTLRLPNDEKTHYLESVIDLPSIEHSLNKSFDEVAGMSIPHIQLRVPLWMLLATSSVLLILHWYYEIYLPWEFSPLGIKFSAPSVPVFLLIAFLISLFMVFRLYRLKDKIIKNFRRGANGS